MWNWNVARKITKLPHIEDNPELVLGRTLDKARQGHVKAVLVGILWEDGSVAVDNSVMKMSELAFLAKYIEIVINEQLCGR